MRRRYRSRRYLSRRFSSARRAHLKFGWLPINLALTSATGSAPEPTDKVVQGPDLYPATSLKVLDWGRTSRMLLERVVLTVVVTMSACATKALVRWLFGLRVVKLDANDALGTAPLALPSLAMTDEDDTRTDWMWTGETRIETTGDNTLMYTTPEIISLDFKPRRYIARDEALIFQYRPDSMTGSWVDATYKAQLGGRLGFKTETPQS